MIRTAWILLCLVVCSSAEHDGSAPDADTEDAEAVPCEPQACWDEAYSSLDCLLNPRSAHGRDCRRLNATEMCRVFEDALRCSSEVGDSGCAFKSGRESFDSWIRGLEAINTKLCFESVLNNILAYAQCWDVLRFANCVQHFVGHLQHVADLAHLPAAEPLPHQPPREQCHLAMLRISKCAGLAARQDPADQGPTLCARSPVVDHVNEILAAYFAASECGGVGADAGPGGCPPPAPPQLEASPATAPPPPPPRAAAQGHDVLEVADEAPAQHPAACAAAATAATAGLAGLALAAANSAVAILKSA